MSALTNSGVGTKPMVSFALTINSTRLITFGVELKKTS